MNARTVLSMISESISGQSDVIRNGLSALLAGSIVVTIKNVILTATEAAHAVLAAKGNNSLVSGLRCCGDHHLI